MKKGGTAANQRRNRSATIPTKYRWHLSATADNWRDTQPENVLVTESSEDGPSAVKLADFGIAILLDERPNDAPVEELPAGVVTIRPVVDEEAKTIEVRSKAALENAKTMLRPAAAPSALTKEQPPAQVALRPGNAQPGA